MIEQGVAVDQTYDYAVPYLAPFRKLACGEYPRALQASQEVLNLPIYPGLKEKDARRVAASVRWCLDRDYVHDSRQFSTDHVEALETEALVLEGA